MQTITILGASGMLGGMLVEYFSTRQEYLVIATVRDATYARNAAARLPNVQWISAGADHENCSVDLESIPPSAWIINAIGITKPLIKDNDPAQVQRAIWVNGMLPHLLGKFAEKRGARVLQIATDCVYSGEKGGYVESDAHDPRDVYGRTKSLGECYLPNVHHLRCSIIGPEFKERRFLIEWFRSQASGSTVRGFRNHQWNGVTTLHFARSCHGVIQSGIALPHLQHIIPGDVVSKAEMLQAFASEYRRPDIHIDVVDAADRIDRTLQTQNPDLNRAIWQAAGYEQPPGVVQMIHELSNFPLRLLPT